MNKRPLWQANSSWTNEEIPSFMSPEILLSCSQEPPSGPCRGTGRGYHCKCEHQKKKGINGAADNSNNSYHQHWRWMSASRPGPFTPKLRAPCTHWIENLVGFRAGLPEIEPTIPRSSSPQHSHHTDSTISVLFPPQASWILPTTSHPIPLKSSVTLSWNLC